MSKPKKIPTFFWEYRNRRPDDIDLADYRLEVAGAVEHPFIASLEELAERVPRVEVRRRFYCVNGWSLEALWSGYRVADLLAAVAPRDGFDYLRVTSVGGYEDTSPIQRLIGGDALLATHMDGEPLSVERGKPMRILLFDMYQFKGVKAVKRIEVVADYRPGFWEKVGYSEEMIEIQPYPHFAIDLGEERMPEIDKLANAEPMERSARARRKQS
jgi:DMSO/TMAO reductase YedYZ molybdopterin-dependent catalytic subunit